MTEQISLQERNLSKSSIEFSDFLTNNSIFSHWLRNFNLDMSLESINFISDVTLDIDNQLIRIINIEEERIKLAIQNQAVLSIEFSSINDNTIQSIIEDYCNKFGIQAMNYAFWHEHLTEIITQYLLAPDLIRSVISNCNCKKGEFECSHVKLGIIALGIFFGINPQLYLSMISINLNNLQSRLTNKRINYFIASNDEDYHNDEGSTGIIIGKNYVDSSLTDIHETADQLKNKRKKKEQRNNEDAITRDQNIGKPSLQLIDTDWSKKDKKISKEPTFYYPNQVMKAVLFEHNRLPQKDQFHKINQLQNIKGVGPVFAKSFLDAGIDSAEEISQIDHSTYNFLENSIPPTRLDKIIQKAKSLHHKFSLSALPRSSDTELRELKLQKRRELIDLVTSYQQRIHPYSILNDSISDLNLRLWLLSKNTIPGTQYQFDTIDDRIKRRLEGNIFSDNILNHFTNRSSVSIHPSIVEMIQSLGAEIRKGVNHD